MIGWLNKARTSIIWVGLDPVSRRPLRERKTERKEFCLKTVTKKFYLSFQTILLCYGFQTQYYNSNSYLNLQPATVPHKFLTCQSPQSQKPIPDNKSPSLSGCMLFVLLLQRSTTDIHRIEKMKGNWHFNNICTEFSQNLEHKSVKSIGKNQQNQKLVLWKDQ